MLFPASHIQKKEAVPEEQSHFDLRTGLRLSASAWQARNTD